MKIMITGGAGFIGSAVIRHLLSNTGDTIVNIDCLSYAGNLDSLVKVDTLSGYQFEHVDIRDPQSLRRVFTEHQPDAVMHLAAESHVDRSIDGPGTFITTNVVGTYNLLEATREYWSGLPQSRQEAFRFHHVSTDEVYGELKVPEDLFTETSPYAPSSPYSASKACSDHLVRAWHRTYGLPVLLTNCSNNYGPFHFPEKLIPHIILNALRGRSLPIYGEGSQIRDWLYVEDHARALHLVIKQGKVSETYNIGGHNEKTNLEVVQTICNLLEELAPIKPSNVSQYHDLICFVKDRPGHDQRYAIDASKVKRELGWTPHESFESGMRKTVKWYLNNKNWWKRVLSGDYQLERIGTQSALSDAFVPTSNSKAVLPR